MNRFYISEHCSTELRILGMSLQLRWIIEGTISKEVELRDIHLINRFITWEIPNKRENSKLIVES